MKIRKRSIVRLPLNRLSAAMLYCALLGSLSLYLAASMFTGHADNNTVFPEMDFSYSRTAIAFGLLLAGMCLLGCSWCLSRGWEQWLTVPVFFSIAFASLALSGSARNQENIEFNASLQKEADTVAHEAELRLDEIYKALARISNRWQAQDGTPQALWEKDATAYLRDYPYLQALSWADAQSRIQWIIARKAVTKAKGFRLDSEPLRAEAIRKAIATRMPQTTPTLKLLNGDNGFIYIIPLYGQERFQGFQIAVFGVENFFEACLTEDFLSRYYISVEDKNRLFSNFTADTDHHPKWTHRARFKSLDTAWTIAISPRPQVLAQRNTALPSLLLIVGLLTSVLVTLCVFLTLLWHRNAVILGVRERALEKSNSLNHAILSSAAYLIIAVDTQGKVIVFNAEAQRALGYQADEVIGKMTPALWHTKQEVLERAETLSREFGRPVEPHDVYFIKPRLQGYEEQICTFKRRDQTSFPAHLTVTLLKGNDGEIVGYLGIIQDITERRRQEEAIKTSEETFRLAMENASIGNALISSLGRFLKVNKALCDIIGYSAEEMLALDFQSITHADDLETEMAFFWRTLAGETTNYQVEKRYIHKQGGSIIVLANVSLVRNADGTPAYFIAQIQDITERKRAEIELKSSEAFNRSLMEASADCVQVLDVRGYILQMNTPGRVSLDIGDFATVFGKEWWTFWPEETQEEVRNSVEMAASGSQYRFQAFCPTVKGVAKWWDVQVSPVCGSEGEIVYILSVSRDITQSKEIERMKTEFISTVSHELRTPLTSIRGSIGLLTGGIAGPLTPKMADLMSIAYKNSERLVRLINNILDIEKIESGRMAFDLKPITVQALLQQASEEIHGFAAQYGVNVVLEDRAANACIIGDYDRLLQVIGNLLSNAIKYSPAHGIVTLKARRKDGRIFFSVVDRGLGIPDAFKPHIFNKFAQADSSDTRQKGGTGLGLSISRAIVESMQGAIGFESGPGRTEFYFSLSERVEAGVQEAPILEMEGKESILICEDDPDIASLLQMILRKEGFDCDIARNAAEAKRKLTQHDYVAMTLDLHLPDQDGISLIRELRLDPATVSLPIIVVSAMAEQGRKALGNDVVGVIDWLSKPIDTGRIKRVLAGISIGRRMPSILHVEDDADLAHLLSVSLKEVANVVHAGSLSEARGFVADQSFDLAILDLRLGDGSGLELLPELSARAIPVIILSMDETPREVQDKVAASLIKSVASESKIIQTIRAFITQSKENI